MVATLAPHETGLSKRDSFLIGLTLDHLYLY